jgi:hypothetical protein
MNIFTQIKNSIYGPKYYRDLLEKPFPYSLKYYSLFALLFAVVFAVVITIKFIPAERFLADQSNKLANYFPEELTINIKDGKATSNVNEPYFINLPENLKSKEGKSNIENLENIIVIDTKDKFNLEAFDSYKTFALLTSDSVAYINNNQVAISSLKEVDNLSLNRQSVETVINKLKPFIVLLYPIVALGSYVGGFLMVAFTLIYLLLGALLVWLIAWIKGLKIGYGKAFQFGMHLLVLPIIITNLIRIFPFKIAIPFLFTLLLIVAALLNLNKKEVVDNP